MKITNDAIDVNVFFYKKLKIRYNIKEFIKKILVSEKKNKYCINIIFVDDKKIKQINSDFRFKTNTTDVISFNYDKNIYSGGDVFISVDTARSNAKKYGVNFELEILRLVAHGVLHILGYDHTKFFRNTEIMKRKQEKYIKNFLMEN
jgi:rRNA maturation RNase YbeY